MFHAASLRIGNWEEHPQVVALFKDAGGRSHRQHAGLLDGVSPPPVRPSIGPVSAVPPSAPRRLPRSQPACPQSTLTLEARSPTPRRR
jgi:hypothetical protein